MRVYEETRYLLWDLNGISHESLTVQWSRWMWAWSGKKLRQYRKKFVCTCSWDAQYL